MRVLVFHNPSAGHAELSRDALTGALQRAGHDVRWFEKGEGKLSEALAEPFDTVVVAGGDGSVGAVGRELAARPLPIAILPAGTANNLAKILGATHENLIQRLADGRVVSFDLGAIEGSISRQLFLEGVGRGPFADTVALLDFLEHRQSPAGREDELMRDLHALRESVLTSDTCECRIDLDGQEVRGEFVMVEITNAGVIGPNLQLSPGAVPFDGLLDVFLVDASEREELLKLVIERRENSPPTTTFRTRRARRVRFRGPAGQQLHIDGKQLRHEGAMDLRITLEPSALQFYVPRDMRWETQEELQIR
jgi:diacylglycerol kinase (ATP)